jgi:hypothetical protein
MMTRRLVSAKILALSLIIYRRSTTAEMSLKRMSHRILLMIKRILMMLMMKRTKRKNYQWKNNPKSQLLLLMNRISS